MRVAYVVETYTEGLGYIDNILPRELATLGDEVRVFTCRLPPYYQNAKAHFGQLSDQAIFPAKVHLDGCDIYTLPYRKVGGRVVLVALRDALVDFRPDVVVVRGLSSFVLAQVICAKLFLRFRIFTSSGQSYSAIPQSLREGGALSRARITNFFSKYLLGKIFHLFVESCIASSEDCKRVVVDFYGVKAEKVIVVSLGVDTRKFYPSVEAYHMQESTELRRRLGIPEGDIVCIWTGRMTGQKNIRLLAEAVETLSRRGHGFSAVFIGAGPEISELEGFTKSHHIGFMPWAELPPYYRMADVAVWPMSITTSTLDASACGLPVILSDREGAAERWTGIGETYCEGSLDSLMEKLLQYSDVEERQRVGAIAADVMRRNFSWAIIAERFRDLLKTGRGDDL